MAKINRRKLKKPPEGYEKIEPTLVKLQEKLKQVQRSSIKTENKHSSLWPVFQVDHQINRYIYSLYYERKQISSELYEWLLQQKYANKDLIAKWKKQGYEKLCCLSCIMVDEKNHKNTCVCRVPKSTLKENNDSPVECITCGCKGCASTD
ncbi:Piso0_004133 [Millerozyma farinosa CBS 7064]|uniref:Piso0_004133 protein n=1 Tax=Pichia sorbitophila (strain ATCC MYA-4447 / BCRC 22081 / CBS 7064 / NBRC 10061 / NRRL Y-12695) TaxID=559304 RepID=G8Y7K5_PICSO|nr:Piso0_004133 [Millerozyma farinosa CBS 7064]CCE84585.1 Piso0_004133 [Millerozyma farinosa CBS 7064]